MMKLMIKTIEQLSGYPVIVIGRAYEENREENDLHE